MAMKPVTTLPSRRSVRRKAPHYVSIYNYESLSDRTLRQGSSLDAFEKIDSSLNECQAELGSDNPEVGLAARIAGDACYHNEDFGQAHRYYTQALSIYQANLNQKHSSTSRYEVHQKRTDIADLHVAIGLALQRQGKEKTEISHFLAAMKLYRCLLKEMRNANEGSVHMALRVVNTWNHIGNASFDSGHYDIAMERYKYALKDALLISSQLTMKDRSGDGVGKTLKVYIANILNNIANVHGAKNEGEESMKFYNEALEIQMEALGECDPALALTLHNIGTNYYHGGHFQLALKAFKQVLKMRRAILGSEHPSLADVLADIAMVMESMGNDEGSIEVYEEAMRLTKLSYGTQNVKLAKYYQDIGMVKMKQSRCEQAIAHFDAACSIYRASGFDNESPCVLALLKNIDNAKNRRRGESSSGLSSMFDFRNSYNSFHKIMECEPEDDWLGKVFGCMPRTETVTLAVS